ncbi:GGDEF domain-containing protein, partial [Deinococcus sp.]|uniref:GGDEF domain-containing protein n=1 Tax=Deinococcus sp. TaxID=47478 RepID=UPI0025D51958
MPAFPDAWGELRRRAYLQTAPVAVLACLCGVATQWPRVNPLDAVMLSVLVLTILGFGLGLGQRKLSVDAALGSVYLVAAFYLLIKLHQHYVTTVGAVGRLDEVVFWFPALFCVAYLAWDLGRATFMAGLTYAGLVMITLVNVPHLMSGDQWPSPLQGILIQFCLSQGAVVALLYGFAFLKHRYTQMQALAHTDALTGLPNRRYVEDQALLYTEPLALLIFDVDHFKAVNDRHGHQVGDGVLRELARLACAELQELQSPGFQFHGLHHSALLTRWGGEEFVLLLPGGDEVRALALAERLRSAFERHDWSAVG